MSVYSIQQILKGKGLKVTPQRLAVYEAVVTLRNHPAAENIIDFIKKNHPHISVGTVYKILDSFVENGLLIKVKSEKGIMRYDALLDHHHHLYCNETDRIEDYEDEQLDELIRGYFRNRKIKNFRVQDIKLQITGTFKN